MFFSRVMEIPEAIGERGNPWSTQWEVTPRSAYEISALGMQWIARIEAGEDSHDIVAGSGMDIAHLHAFVMLADRARAFRFMPDARYFGPFKGVIF